MSIFNQLFETVYYGTDLEFKYNGNYYFINSGKIIQDNVSMHSITVYKSKNSFYEGDNNENCIEIYSSCLKNPNENTNYLFEMKIFDGKSLCEIIDFITDISF